MDAAVRETPPRDSRRGDVPPPITQFLSPISSPRRASAPGGSPGRTATAAAAPPIPIIRASTVVDDNLPPHADNNTNKDDDDSDGDESPLPPLPPMSPDNNNMTSPPLPPLDESDTMDGYTYNPMSMLTPAAATPPGVKTSFGDENEMLGTSWSVGGSGVSGGGRPAVVVASPPRSPGRMSSPGALLTAPHTAPHRRQRDSLLFKNVTHLGAYGSSTDAPPPPAPITSWSTGAAAYDMRTTPVRGHTIHAQSEPRRRQSEGVFQRRASEMADASKAREVLSRPVFSGEPYARRISRRSIPENVSPPQHGVEVAEVSHPITSGKLVGETITMVSTA